ncbi:unnamed protein product [Protopolystoma xenopodis]|uniref:Uncharacterized protein n=1 Tax=Protopolystoma xenopodis TaxID=117903 RepID=A0A3S4ZYD5_9PLAT|nr:unnamed protein product [Protopolystoma xenopodis]
MSSPSNRLILRQKTSVPLSSEEAVVEESTKVLEQQSVPNKRVNEALVFLHRAKASTLTNGAIASGHFETNLAGAKKQKSVACMLANLAGGHSPMKGMRQKPFSSSLCLAGHRTDFALSSRIEQCTDSHIQDVWSTENTTSPIPISPKLRQNGRVFFDTSARRAALLSSAGRLANRSGPTRMTRPAWGQPSHQTTPVFNPRGELCPPVFVTWEPVGYLEAGVGADDGDQASSSLSLSLNSTHAPLLHHNSQGLFATEHHSSLCKTEAASASLSPPLSGPIVGRSNVISSPRTARLGKSPNLSYRQQQQHHFPQAPAYQTRIPTPPRAPTSVPPLAIIEDSGLQATDSSTEG